MIWTTFFEGAPGGSDFGSVTATSLRQLKSLTKSLLIKEHTFDESEVPIIMHKVGYCSVFHVNAAHGDIGIDGLGNLNNQYILRGELSDHLLGTYDHRQFTFDPLNDSHPQYVKNNFLIFNSIVIDDIINIDNSEDYPTILTNDNILSKSQHLKADSTGGAYHKNNVVRIEDIDLPNFPASMIYIRDSERTSPHRAGGSLYCLNSGANPDFVRITPMSGTSGSVTLIPGIGVTAVSYWQRAF